MKNEIQRLKKLTQQLEELNEEIEEYRIRLSMIMLKGSELSPLEAQKLHKALMTVIWIEWDLEVLCAVMEKKNNRFRFWKR